MKIFLKYILKSMTEKKGRAVLLLLAIVMSVGLFVCSNGVIEIGIKASTKPYIEAYENKEIVINGTNDIQFFSASDIKEEGVKNLVKEIYYGGRYIDKDDNPIYTTVLGREDKYIDDELIIKGSLDEFDDAKCIISQRISEERDINIGDKVEFIIGGQSRELEVQAISKNEKIFYTDSKNEMTIVVPYEYLGKLLGAEGKYNTIFADKTGESLDDCISQFNEANDDCKAEVLFDEEKVKEQMSSFTTMLYSMLVIVALMSTIIIYGSFKLTVTERLPVIGTFLSQGATTGTVEKILIMESIFYGLIGGVLGGLLGIVGLNLVNYLVSPLKDYGIVEKIQINYFSLVLGLIFSIILSVVSALIPIMKIRRLQVKDVILNNVNITMRIGWKKFITGIILIALSIGVAFCKGQIFDIVSIFAILVAIIGAILVYPKFVDIISTVLYKVLKGRSKSLVFAINNLRTSKVLIGNITLIIISLSSILMITSLGTSIMDMLTGCYNQLNFDVCIQNISSVNEGQVPCVDLIKKDIENIEGIDKSTYLEEYYQSVKIDDQNIMITCIDEDAFCDMNKYIDLKSDKNIDAFNKFKEKENSLLMSEKQLSMLGKKVGEYVTVDINGKDHNLEIVGSYDGKLYNMGVTTFMKNSTLTNLYDMKDRDSLEFSTTKSQEDIKDDLKFLTKKYGVKIVTQSEYKKSDEENNQMIIDILNIFSYMAMIIASFGILNNIIIGFLQRKRELAVLTSVGMSNGKRNMMLVFESLLSVVWAFVITIPLGILLMKLMCRVSVAIELPVYTSLDFSLIPGYFVGTLVIILFATLPVIYKNKKLSVVNELKYE